YVSRVHAWRNGRWSQEDAMNSLPLSTSAQAVLSEAAEESSRLGHRFLGVEHLFAALTTGKDSSFEPAFEGQGIALGDFVARLMDRVEPLEHHPWGADILITPRCKGIIGLATMIAIRNRKPVVTREHLLEAIFREGRSVPMRLLRSNEVHVA